MKVKVNIASDADAVRNSPRVDKVAREHLASTVKSPSPAATLSVYANAAKIDELTDVLKNMPALRAERVETLRTRIALGEFNPSSETIADRILTSLD